jgi:hypothetical protein
MPRHSRISEAILDADRAALRAIADMSDYAPSNGAIATAALQQLETTLALAELQEERARRAADDARDAAIAAGRQFHELMLVARAQVVGQYGHNSRAVEAIGYKKKSEHRRPARRRDMAAD